MVNIGVLTTGFDAPNIDCVAMLRPTKSPGLYYQMTGRGFRPHPGKEDCLVLDFGGNVLRHGPVDAIQVRAQRGHNGNGVVRTQKECPACQSIVPAGTAECPDCGHQLIVARRIHHDAKPADAEILAKPTDEYLAVQKVEYSVHTKRDGTPDDPKTLRVDYTIGWNRVASEWICVGHTGYAREKAETWWRQRSHASVPETAEEAVILAEAGALAETKEIIVRHDPRKRYPKITRHVVGDRPSWREPGDEDADEFDEEPVESCEGVPF